MTSTPSQSELFAAAWAAAKEALPTVYSVEDLYAQGWRSPTIDCGGHMPAEAKRLHRHWLSLGFESRGFQVRLAEGRETRTVKFFRPRLQQV